MASGLKRRASLEQFMRKDSKVSEDRLNNSPSDVKPAGSDYSAQQKGLDSEGIASWMLGELDNFIDEVEGYLLDVRYDGRFNRAVAFILDSTGRLLRWVDRTDHRPYFLTDVEPESAGALGLSDSELIVQFDVVSKFHPIRRERVKLLKVIVRDPLAVRKLRDFVKSKGHSVWEADIKYHHNYIFDNQLVPGMKYKVGKKWERSEWRVTLDFLEELENIIRGESKHYQELAWELAHAFEQEPPKVRRAALDVEVYTPEAGKVPDASSAQYPVISVALADNEGRRKVFLLHREGVGFEAPVDGSIEVEIFDDELSLILEVFRELEKYPVVLTFNGDSFDLPYIYNRLINLGVDPSIIPIEVHEDKVTFKHSLHVDIYKLLGIKALQVYAFGGKYRELTLDAISEALLGVGKVGLEELVSKVSLDTLVAYNVRDAELTVGLTTFSNDLVWNLVIMIMRISKLGIEDVTRHQVSMWIRGLMNWEHRRRGWLIPAREELKGSTARSKAIIKEKKYKGAIVLEPPQGVIFNVLVLDYASLYPSIIKNWNLSYETLNNPKCSSTKIIPEVNYEVCVDFKGITSEIVGLLRDFRVNIYKKKAKDQKLPLYTRLWYDVVQAALKVYINASYGVFGNEAFPLYSLPVAESVTAIGRTIMLDTLKYARDMSLQIVYGDTDSIFLRDPDEESLRKLTSYIVSTHGLDIEVDRKFKVALFSGLKKNYLGITDKGEMIIKGMVGKKSNTPEFIKGEFKALAETLKELNSPEDVAKVLEKVRSQVSEVYRRLRNKGYALDELAIKIMLSKDPNEYTKTTPQHVKAAKLLQKEGLQIAKGDVIAFVKTKDPIGVKPVRLAKLAEVDTTKYVEYVKTAFEQILLSFGVKWEEMTGQKNLSTLLNLKEETRQQENT
ncbi:MAG: DNA-directed DNA polymerase I [Thermoprotei archaeon]|nr:DNA-directed DNA polymerase I [Thermoprotei archaeon]